MIDGAVLAGLWDVGEAEGPGEGRGCEGFAAGASWDGDSRDGTGGVRVTV